MAKDEDEDIAEEEGEEIVEPAGPPAATVSIRMFDPITPRGVVPSTKADAPCMLTEPKEGYPTKDGRLVKPRKIKRNGETVTVPACWTQLVWRNGQAFLRFCDSHRTDGVLIPVRNAHEARQISNEYCACYEQQGYGDPAACIARTLPGYDWSVDPETKMPDLYRQGWTLGRKGKKKGKLSGLGRRPHEVPSTHPLATGEDDSVNQLWPWLFLLGGMILVLRAGRS